LRAHRVSPSSSAKFGGSMVCAAVVRMWLGVKWPIREGACSLDLSALVAHLLLPPKVYCSRVVVRKTQFLRYYSVREAN